MLQDESKIKDWRESNPWCKGTAKLQQRKQKHCVFSLAFQVKHCWNPQWTAASTRATREEVQEETLQVPGMCPTRPNERQKGHNLPTFSCPEPQFVSESHLQSFSLIYVLGGNDGIGLRPRAVTKERGQRTLQVLCTLVGNH